MNAEEFRFPPPAPSDLGDHEVPRDGNALDGARVALLVTGGIAAFKAPLLARALRRQGAVVTAFATTEALRYVAREALEGSTVRVAAVATGFPSAQYPLDIRLRDCADSIAAGADEIDMVISRGLFLAGRLDEIAHEIRETRAMCARPALPVFR